MNYCVRQIRKRRWIAETTFSKKDFPADPLADLNTQQNSLSVFEITEDKSNFNDILIHFATKSEYDGFNAVEYVLIDVNKLEKLGFSIKRSEAVTKYPKCKTFHRDLVSLTADKICELARIIDPNNISFVVKKDVIDLVKCAILKGDLDINKLNEKMKSKLGH